MVKKSNYKPFVSISPLSLFKVFEGTTANGASASEAMRSGGGNFFQKVFPREKIINSSLFPKAGIDTAEAQKFIVCATLRYSLVGDNEDLVGVHYGGKSVCHNDGRSADTQFLK